MNKKYVVFFALVACLTGCVPLDSLNPIYTDKDIVFDRSLVGAWVTADKKDNSTLKFVALEENGKETGYTVTMTDLKGEDECQSMEFQARLVNFGGHRFLDLARTQWEANTYSYPLKIKQARGGASIEPRFLRLGMAAYMEFTGGPQPRALLRTAHWFFRVATDGKTLRLDWVDDDKFRKAVAEGKFHIVHALLSDQKSTDVLVTAGTLELQKFLTEHGDDEALFTEHMNEMVRKPQ
jgi:hypothetical protein